MISPEILQPEPTSRQPFHWSIQIAIAVFYGTRLYFLFNLTLPIYSDMYLYMTFAVNGVDLDKTPYLDFPLEYPPASYYFFALPRLLSGDRLTEEDFNDMAGPNEERKRKANEKLNSEKDTYFRAFRIEMLICDVLAFGLFVATALKRRPEYAGWASLAYALATASLNEVLYDRFDTGLLLLLVLWAWLTISSWRDGAARSTLGLAAYLVLGLGVAYKLIPVVAFPLLALADLKSARLETASKDALRLAVRWTAFAFGILLPSAWFLIAAGKKTFDFLAFHNERGIEVESIYATALIVLSWFGVPLHAFHDYGCWQIQTPANDLSTYLAQGSTVLILLMLMTAFFWFCFQPRSTAKITGYRVALWAMIASVTCAKVLSVQFLVWLLPLILLLTIETTSRWEFGGLLCVTLITAALTTWIFPYHFTPYYIYNGRRYFNAEDFALIPDLGRWPCMVLVVRNLLLVGLMSWLGWKTIAAAAIRPDRVLPADDSAR